MIILTEATPNPRALKFIVRLEAVPGAFEWDRAQAAEVGSPLARRLFAIDGVARLFVTADFVTVQRDARGPEWDVLKYAVLQALADHLASCERAIESESGAVADAPVGDGIVQEIVEEIQAVLHRHVRPGVAQDGGDVVFVRFDAADGTLWVRMLGACGGCPSARGTLKTGVEQLVRRYVPEVLRVEEVAPEPGEGLADRLKRWLGATDSAQGGRPTRFTHNGRSIRS